MLHILENKAMLVGVNIRLWTANKLDRKATNEVHANNGAASDSGRYNKRLIAKEALRPIIETTGEARALHYANTLPWSDEGWRLLPATNFPTWSDEMRRLKNTFDSLVPEFVNEYPSLKIHAQRSLGTLFRDADYPDASNIATRFSFETSVQPVPSGSHFVLDVAKEDLKAMQASVDARVQDATDAAMADLWKRLYSGVEHMAERLKAYDPTGDKVVGKFHDTLVTNLEDLVNLLPRLNVTNDPELAKMVDRVKNGLTGVTPAKLREDHVMRREIAATADQIVDQMSAFMSA